MPLGQSVSGNSAVFTGNSPASENAKSSEIPASERKVSSEFSDAFQSFRDREIQKIHSSFWGIISTFVLFFVLVFGCVCCANLADSAIERTPGMNACVILSTVLMLADAIALFVFYLLFLYHLWRVIPNFLAYTSPGRAAGFMMVPVVNLIWPFFMFMNLTQHLNELGNYKRIPHSNLQVFAIIYCILELLPYINILCTIFVAPIFFHLLKKNTINLLQAMTAEDYSQEIFYARQRKFYLESLESLTFTSFNHLEGSVKYASHAGAAAETFINPQGKFSGTDREFAEISWLIPIHTSGYAIAAGYLGLLGCFPPLGLLALIFGAIALQHIARTGLYGRGRAWFGILAGSFWTLVYFFVIFFIVSSLP